MVSSVVAATLGLIGTPALAERAVLYPRPGRPVAWCSQSRFDRQPFAFVRVGGGYIGGTARPFDTRFAGAGLVVVVQRRFVGHRVCAAASTTRRHPRVVLTVFEP